MPYVEELNLMNEEIREFADRSSSAGSSLRTILLFGNNTATYKFALTHVLLRPHTHSALKYEDLRDDFVLELFRHYNGSPCQYTSGANNLTRAFERYAQDHNWDQLIKVAERVIYNNVFDAFHHIGRADIKDEFRLFEHDKAQRQLILTDNLYKILEDRSLTEQLSKENQSRWQIVEEAWRHKISPNLLVYDRDQNVYSIREGQARVNLRSAVDILLPYQHGRCFYCHKWINTNAEHDEHDFPDVDHVIAHSAFNSSEVLSQLNANGMWNLVVACMECNRGRNGKFDRPVTSDIYEQLIDRNTLFTHEHKHSLKNTILLSLGLSHGKQVRSRMRVMFGDFSLLTGWRPRVREF